MNKLLPAFALLLAPLAAFNQAQIVMNGSSKIAIVESGGTAAKPIYIDVNNPNANAFKTINTANTNQAFIVSESEFNMVKWDIGTNIISSDTVPFGEISGGTWYYLPVRVDFSAPGTGNGSLLFSTFHTTPLNAPYPSDVNNMGYVNAPADPGPFDNSYNAVDRFYIIDAYKGAFAYTTKPTLGNITFTYIHSGLPEFAAPNNAAAEASLITQRFNPAPMMGWGDWIGGNVGSTITGNTGRVSSGVVSASNFYRSWTLSNNNFPLPVEVSSFTAICDNGTSALIQWTSQSELDNALYTVKKTTDGIHFETVGTKAGAGTTSLPTNYSIVDNNVSPGTSYYTLEQTDYNGDVNSAYSGSIAFTGCETGSVTTVKGYNTTNNIVIEISAVEAGNYNITLTNMLGQTVYAEQHAAALGNNEIMLSNNYSPGIYILNVKNDQVNYANKLVIGVK